MSNLEGERKKLLEAHYADAVPLDLLKSEQVRSDVRGRQRRRSPSRGRKRLQEGRGQPPTGADAGWGLRDGLQRGRWAAQATVQPGLLQAAPDRRRIQRTWRAGRAVRHCCWATICAEQRPSGPARSCKKSSRRPYGDGRPKASSSRTSSTHGNQNGPSWVLDRAPPFLLVVVLLRQVWCARVDSNHHGP